MARRRRLKQEIHRVYLDRVEATVLLDLDGALVVESPFGQVFFGDPDCTGQAFVDRRFVARVTGAGGRLFIGRGEPSSDPEYRSRLTFTAVCLNDQLPGPLTNAIPADEITLDDLGIPFPRPGPLSIGLKQE